MHRQVFCAKLIFMLKVKRACILIGALFFVSFTYANSFLATDIKGEQSLGLSSPFMPEITVSPFINLYFGTISELVYFQDHLLSELLWHVNGLPMLGTELNLQWKSGLSFTIQGAFGLGMFKSTIEDSDWFNWDPYYTLPQRQTGKTHYSRHTNKHSESYTAEIRLAQSFLLSIENPYSKKRSSFTLSPGCGFRYYYWAFEAWDGYTQYATMRTPDGLVEEWKASWPKVQMDGKGISYAQEIWFPDFSLEISAPFLHHIQVDVSFAFSPFVYCYALDEHHVRDLLFFDSLSKGMFFEPSLNITYMVSPRFSTSLQTSGFFISNLRGDTHLYENNINTVKSLLKEGHGGGAEVSLGEIRLSCTFRVF